MARPWPRPQPPIRLLRARFFQSFDGFDKQRIGNRMTGHPRHSAARPPVTEMDSLPPKPLQAEAAELDALAAELECTLDSLCAAVLARCTERVEPWVIESAFEQISSFILEGLREELYGLRQAALPEHCPDAALDLDLDRHHLGLIAWGEDPRAAALDLAAALGRPLIVVNPPGREQTCWAWISGTRPLGAAERRTLRSLRPTLASIVLGREANGEEGFCASHRQALRTRRFDLGQGPAIVHYDDIVIEALASENEPDACAFVAHELRGIEDESAAPMSEELSWRWRPSRVCHVTASFRRISIPHRRIAFHPDYPGDLRRRQTVQFGRSGPGVALSRKSIPSSSAAKIPDRGNRETQLGTTQVGPAKERDSN